MGHSLTNQVDMQKLNESVVTSIKNKINYFGDRSNLHGVGHVVSQTPIPGFKSKELPPTLTPFFKEVFFYNNKYCKTCMTCKMNSTCVENFLELVKDYRLACEEMLTECWFRPIQTEYGGCFVFNSRSRLTSNESMLVVNRQIRVHSPDDEVSIKTDRVSEKVDLIVLASEVNAEATTSDVSINLLDPVKRGCLLVHEKPAFAQHWPFPRYSYNACVLYCRAMKQYLHIFWKYYYDNEQLIPTFNQPSDCGNHPLTSAPMAHCSVAQCSLPCRGAAPPPSCPDTIPQCASGCACMADCEQQAIVCFETKHCVQRKKYYARTMKHKGAYARVD
ncbi:hypothetical protein MSG28_007948 [Choristoneura fumiferana]|uniref:Uncharacterized protein n=1 Tax=Choristoneura fumiferana TaxID=7141 RepID=A0ACC0J9C2_CHOFU|nr:hypothetical protein MSG28_007948 [Choristoneura fumiferana]